MTRRKLRVGFYNPFLTALGGGDKYLFRMLEEVVRRGDSDVIVYCPNDPKIEQWGTLGVDVDADGVTWIRAAPADVTEQSADLDLLVVLSNDVPVLSRAAASVAMIQFPYRPRDRWRERVRAKALGLAGLRRAPAALGSYDLFLCYSHFAQHWIRRRLGVDATILAPPIDPPIGAIPKQKERRVLSVGRFVSDVHDKRHDILIEAFAKLRTDHAVAAKWQLDLVGTANDDRSSARLLERLRASADGLPIRFHVNASYHELLKLYSASDLFWHATGYGVDPERHPERLEHFGMVTAEAMMHAAVPLVLPLGGQAEIVSDGRNGRYWRSIPELAAHTAELIDDRAQAERLRGWAHRDVRRFSTEHFRERVRKQVLEPAIEHT